MSDFKLTNNQRIILRERNAVMFNNESLADVHFLVKSSGGMQKIPAHKYVLALGSPVFKTMFCGSLPEKDVIEISDVEPSSFLSLLRFLYCDKINLNEDNVSSILYVAKKYQVECAINFCLDYTETRLSGQNVWSFLNNIIFDEITFVKKCWEVIDVNTKSAIEAKDFTHISKKTLETFLRRNTLNCKEVDIFKAVVRWVDVNNSCEEHASTNKYEILGILKYLIRIPTMTLEEFGNVVVDSDFLSEKEIKDIFMYYATKKQSYLHYSTVPRIGLKKQLNYKKRYTDELGASSVIIE